MNHSSTQSPINTNQKFELNYSNHVKHLIAREPVNRGPAHATTDQTMAETHELMHVTDVFQVPEMMGAWQTIVDANLPWAEDHFQERVSGKPLNPAPSEAWWPFARQGNAEHKKDQIFSHTYPERFWPKNAGRPSGPYSYEGLGDHNKGIRYPYGDLNNLISVLQNNPHSRQAYLPIWFPEDLAAACLGERVPCSMGYHFISNRDRLDCVYTMRSCDIVRFYRDDIYMAGRLLQYVAEEVDMGLGQLVVHIDNLHCFPGDVLFLQQKVVDVKGDKRLSYNFDGLM